MDARRPAPLGQDHRALGAPRRVAPRALRAPTALRPWILTAPDGREVRTGVWVGMSREHGTTWERLARAMIWVAGHEDDAAYGGRPGAVVERRDPGPMWARP